MFARLSNNGVKYSTQDMVYTYNGILLSRKKNKIMSFAAMWKDLEVVILSEVNQTKTKAM